MNSQINSQYRCKYMGLFSSFSVNLLYLFFLFVSWAWGKQTILELSLISLWRSGIEWHSTFTRVLTETTVCIFAGELLYAQQTSQNSSFQSHTRTFWDAFSRKIDFACSLGTHGSTCPQAFSCILPICFKLRGMNIGRHLLVYIWHSCFTIFHNNAQWVTDWGQHWLQICSRVKWSSWQLRIHLLPS